MEQTLLARVGLDQLEPLRRAARELEVAERLLSTGKMAQVAPISGDMFPIVARSASGRFASPGP